MNTALIVIDVQQGLFRSEPPPYRATETIQNINRLIAFARSQDWTVVFIQAEHPELLPKGSEYWQLCKELDVAPQDKILAKQEANAFIRTELRDYLMSMSVDEVVLCGYSTEFCLDSTARYATTLGLHVQLALDAHTTHDKSHLSAAKIIEHHNLTLTMAPTVDGLVCDELGN